MPSREHLGNWGLFVMGTNVGVPLTCVGKPHTTKNCSTPAELPNVLWECESHRHLLSAQSELENDDGSGWNRSKYLEYSSTEKGIGLNCLKCFTQSHYPMSPPYIGIQPRDFLSSSLRGINYPLYSYLLPWSDNWKIYILSLSWVTHFKSYT